MKTKYSLIPFIPALIAAVGLKVMSIFGVDDNGLLFGMNKSTLNYVVIGIVLALFVICVIINITDRKTAPVYAVKKNPVAGFFALLCGFAAAGASFLALVNTATDNADTYLMSIITAVFSIPAAVAFIMIGKIHFSGKSAVSNKSMFYVFPALWGCTELISEFLQATKASISASDMTPLFCYIFITLYLFSSSMIVSRVKGKNPVKASFIYGFPAAVVCLAQGVGALMTATVENTGIQALVSAIMFIVLGVYIVSFLVELFVGCLTKAEVEIIDSLPGDEDTYENSYISSGAYDELIASHDEPEAPARPKSYAEVAADEVNDFVMGYEEEDYKMPADTKPHDFSNDLVFGIEGVDDPDFVNEMNKPAAQPAAEDNPAPRTVMETPAEPKPERFVQTPEKPAEPKQPERAASTDERPAQPAQTAAASQSARTPQPAQRRPRSHAQASHRQGGTARPSSSAGNQGRASRPRPSRPAAPQSTEQNVGQPRSYTSQSSAPQTSGSTVSSDRMSEIDRLLKELEDKK